MPRTATPDGVRCLPEPTTTRHPPRVGPWLWPAAVAAVVGFLAATGAIFLIGVWVAALLIVGVHEVGHALAARWMRVHPSAMVIGVGPMIAGLVWRDLRVEVRAMPVVGWVEMESDETHLGSLRVAVVHAAGPAASFILSIMILLCGFSWMQGPTNVDATDARYAIQTTSEWAWSTWEAPFSPVVDLLARLAGGDRIDGGVPDRGGRSPTATQHDHAEVVSIVGIAASTPQGISDHGTVWVFFVVAGLSAGLAGLNLLPAWGLDGYGIAEEVAWCVGRRSQRHGRHAVRLVRVIGVITAALGLWLIVGVFVRDILEFL